MLYPIHVFVSVFVDKVMSLCLAGWRALRSVVCLSYLSSSCVGLVVGVGFCSACRRGFGLWCTFDPCRWLGIYFEMEIKRSTQFDCSLPFDLLVLSGLLRELHCELNRLLDAIGARCVFLLVWSVKCGLCCMYCMYCIMSMEHSNPFTTV